VHHRPSSWILGALLLREEERRGGKRKGGEGKGKEEKGKGGDPQTVG